MLKSIRRIGMITYYLALYIISQRCLNNITNIKLYTLPFLIILSFEVSGYSMVHIALQSYNCGLQYSDIYQHKIESRIIVVEPYPNQLQLLDRILSNLLTPGELSQP